MTSYISLSRIYRIWIWHRIYQLSDALPTRFSIKIRIDYLYKHIGAKIISTLNLHQCGSTYLVCPTVIHEPKKGLKMHFCVFSPFFSSCLTDWQPYRLNHIDARCINLSYYLLLQGLIHEIFGIKTTRIEEVENLSFFESAILIFSFQKKKIFFAFSS